ncbi:MAG: DUF4870 domain-containing protein [Thermoplasmata archaeon]|nr:DUF4870 domain-containing protein [Thermoplasmata archaeon]
MKKGEEAEKPKEGPKESVFGLDENIAGALAYLGTFITGILLLLMEKENRFVRFHAMQSVVIFLPLIIIINILEYVLYYTCFAWLIVWLLVLLFILVWFLGMWKAYNGEYFKFPIVGDIAENLLEKVKI